MVIKIISSEGSKLHTFLFLLFIVVSFLDSNCFVMY